jgi:hypothetical protein
VYSHNNGVQISACTTQKDAKLFKPCQSAMKSTCKFPREAISALALEPCILIR